MATCFESSFTVSNNKQTYIVQDDIVCRDAISRNEQQCLVVDLEDFADLARCDLLDVVLAEVNLGDSRGYRHVCVMYRCC